MNTKQPLELLVSLSDLKSICFKYKKLILIAAIAGGLLGLTYSLTRPIEYVVEASFKEKGSSSGSGESSMSALLMMSGDSNEQEAISIFSSRRLMETLAKRLNMQLAIKENHYTPGIFGKIRDNLKLSYSVYKERSKPSLYDTKYILLPSNIYYTHETPLALQIQFLNNNTFKVSSDDKDYGTGQLDTPFITSDFSFTLASNEPQLTSRNFQATLIPLTPLAEGLKKIVSIKANEYDKSLFLLTYRHPERHFAANVLNTLMTSYKDYLQEEQNRIAQEQLAYLENRQNKLGHQLQTLMNAHAEETSNDLSTFGSANSEIAMQYLVSNQQKYQEKKQNVELEMKRLHKAQQEGYAYFEHYATGNDVVTVHQTLNQIRDLKQQADAISVAVRNSSEVSPETMQENFTKQIEELYQARRYSDETDQLIADVESDLLHETSYTIFDNPKYLVRAWHEQLHSHLAKEQEHQDDSWQDTKTTFRSYLGNLSRYFQVVAQTLQERLAHQQISPSEFEGIDLKTANDLFTSYSAQLDQAEANILQHQFIIEEMKDPDFEITALSPSLADPVSQEMIQKASIIRMSLKDENNRSVKEQERLRSELDLQKRVLTVHLEQMIKLQRLKHSLIKEKIHGLQNTTLALIDQKISILEKHLADYIESRLATLDHEKEVIDTHLKTVRTEMAALPQKRVSEQLIQQRMEMNKRMIEELSRLVESKNISNNLETNQSTALDAAIAPVYPRQPHILLLTVAGALGGAFMAICGCLLGSIATGVRASPENLKLANQNVSGSISSQLNTLSDIKLLRDSDLDTLRKLITFFNTQPTKQHTILVVQGNGPDLVPHLGHLLQLQDKKVLTLSLTFDQQGTLPGLIQYLEGQAAMPTVTHQGYGDMISAGGIYRFNHELLSSPKFDQLLETLQKKYDWIFAVTKDRADEARLRTLMARYSEALVVITDESLNEIAPVLDFGLEKEHAVTYVFASNQ